MHHDASFQRLLEGSSTLSISCFFSLLLAPHLMHYLSQLFCLWYVLFLAWSPGFFLSTEAPSQMETYFTHKDLSSLLFIMTMVADHGGGKNHVLAQLTLQHTTSTPPLRVGEGELRVSAAKESSWLVPLLKRWLIDSPCSITVDHFKMPSSSALLSRLDFYAYYDSDDVHAQIYERIESKTISPENDL